MPVCSIGQKNFSNTQIRFFSGISSSHVKIAEPLWLIEGNRSTPAGKTIGLDISNRVYRNLWIGMGLGYFRRSYSYRRKDIYNSSNIDTIIKTANYGLDAYAKVEYIRHLGNYYLSGSYSQMLDFNIINNLLIYYPNGSVKTSQDGNYLFGYPKNRSAISMTFGRKLGIKKRTTLGLDINYSFGFVNKKSVESDDINIRSTALSLCLIRNFGGSGYSQK